MESVEKTSKFDGQLEKYTTTVADGTEKQQMEKKPDEEFERKEAGRTTELTLRAVGRNRISVQTNRGRDQHGDVLCKYRITSQAMGLASWRQGNSWPCGNQK